MDSDQGKLFIGGISWETTEEKLKDYFQAFGKVAEAVIMKDRATGRARGFGFVVFTDPSIADMVVLEKHSIDGRMVEAKKAVPRDEQQSVNRSNNGGGGGLTPSNPTRTKKIFVGGLASTVTENDFRKYFGQFGIVTDVVVMYDHGTQRPRGFGFITYDSEDAVDRVLQKTFHDLNEKMVEVKRAVPKDLSAGPIRNNGVGLGVGAGRGGPYGGGYAQALNSSPITSYGMRMDSRYGPSLASRGSYPPYGAIGYGNTGHYSGSVNGAYSAGMHGGGGLYGGGGYGGSSSGSGGYGSIGSRFSSSNASTAYGSSPGRSVWGGGGASYGNVSSSEGFGGTGGPSLSSYGGVGTWGSSQAPSNSSAAYGSHSYGYGGGDGAYISSNSPGYGGGDGGGDGAYISSNSPGYAGQSSRYGSSPGGLGGSRLGSGSSALFEGIYGSSGYGGSTWRATPADTFNSVSAGSGGLRSGVYGLSSGTNDNGEDIQTGEEGYGVTGRQSYRGVPV